MKHILILGATGAMGRYLVPQLSRDGFLVDAVSLDEVKTHLPNVTYYKFDAKNDDLLAHFLSDKKYDAIVDFMLYLNDEFAKRHELLLTNTKHYVFLSSYRVYADEEHPIKETSPRLLDVSDDQEFLAFESKAYALYKARQENLLRNSHFKNWTILRPTMVYSTYRYQLVGLEADTFLYRAQNHKPVILPENALNKHAAMIWSGDVAKMISKLLLNELAYGETFTIGSSEQNTWSEVLQHYRNIINFDIITVSESEYKKIVNCKNPITEDWFQLIYDRFFDRIIDNSKILKVTGLKQSDLLPLEEGLKKELLSIKDKHAWSPSYMSGYMDLYLEITSVN